MLLNKNAFLRASISELLELEALQTRIDKFRAVNDTYLAQMAPLSETQAIEETKHHSEDASDPNDAPFDQIEMGDIKLFQQERAGNSGSRGPNVRA